MNSRQVNAAESVFGDFQDIPVKVFGLVGLVLVLIYNGQVVHREGVVGVFPECQVVLFNGFGQFLIVVVLHAFVEVAVDRSGNIGAAEEK